MLHGYSKSLFPEDCGSGTMFNSLPYCICSASCRPAFLPRVFSHLGQPGWHLLRIICGRPHVWYLTQLRALPWCRVRNTTTSWLGINYDLASSSSSRIEQQLSLVNLNKPLGMLATTISSTWSLLLLTRSGYVYHPG